MKKIFFSIVALAALAACSKSEVAYEQTQEIGFKAVAGNMTKTAVSGDAYPEELNMYVNAWTTDFTGTDANYISNGLFVCKDNFEDYTEKDDPTNVNPIVWGGETPYYWPNTKELYFAGYSASGNVANLYAEDEDNVDNDDYVNNITYDCVAGKLSIKGYVPGTTANNDLMFFPKTSEAYGKSTDYVRVNMIHTCAWITFLVKGDGVTGTSTSSYAVESLTITGIYDTGDLTCTGSDVEWDFTNEDNTPKYTNNATFTVLPDVEGDNTSIAGTNESAVKAENPEDNTVLIPQLPGMLTLVYSYTSPAGQVITETRSDLDLTLDGTAAKATEWEAGKHYIYTITIKANEILIAPTPVDWADPTVDTGVTVQ